MKQLLLTGFVLLLALPAAKAESWVCAFPKVFEPDQLQFMEWSVEGDVLSNSPAYQFKILENNELSIVAARSQSRPWKGSATPRMGADIIVIVKSTGAYRYTPVYSDEKGDLSVFGTCKVK
jgi:hypothetical protein